MSSAQSDSSAGPGWHATTILSVRKGDQVVMAGDGQVSMGQTIVKGNARKVRRIGNGQIVAGFAGATADAFTLFERLETKLEQYPTQLLRACVELAKDWRTDRYLRRLEAMLLVADKEVMRAGYQINLYGTKGWRSVTPDLANLYAYLLEAFLDLVINGNESVPIEEEVELIASLEAAKRSLALGREVQLGEVMNG